MMTWGDIKRTVESLGVADNHEVASIDIYGALGVAQIAVGRRDYQKSAGRQSGIFRLMPERP